MIRKAVVLARGLGTRMRRSEGGRELEPDKLLWAERGLKALIPIWGRPFLDYIVASLSQAGVRRVCLVVAPDADQMRDYARRVSRTAPCEVECAVQQSPRGTADAVLAAERFADAESFILTNSDNLFPVSALSALARRGGEGQCVGVFPRRRLVREGNISEERVREFAVVSISGEGELLGIVEKPSDPDSFARRGEVFVSMNLYGFSPAIFDACRRVAPDPERGELELTSAVTDLIESGGASFDVVLCEGPVLDLTRRADVAAAERALQGCELCF
ncbi:MAG: nucleotidyltransferase family protein [Planctomycetes bacterium]|nr:nucleotidyltransferase family protein [Planctomycetota bacterium]